MAKPPPSGPSSDIHGVNRDARVNSTTRDPQGNDAGDLDHADEQSKGHPDEGEAAADADEGAA